MPSYIDSNPMHIRKCRYVSLAVWFGLVWVWLVWVGWGWVRSDYNGEEPTWNQFVLLCVMVLLQRYGNQGSWSLPCRTTHQSNLDQKTNRDPMIELVLVVEQPKWNKMSMISFVFSTSSIPMIWFFSLMLVLIDVIFTLMMSYLM